MNPTVFQLGPIELHAFTAWIMVGVAVGAAIILVSAARRHQKLMPWLDVIVGAVVGGVVGARAAHVWLNWGYFAAHTNQIADFGNGGLDWHGGVALGLLVAIVVALIRRVPIGQLTDALALGLPFGAICVWLACATSVSGYGVEVGTLADYPSWLVIESQDIYGTVAPRLNLPPIGIALAAMLFVIVVMLTAFRWASTLRLWLAFTFYALGMSLIDFFRAEYVPVWFGRRADQILDYAVALSAILVFGLVALTRRRWTMASNLVAKGI